MRSIYFIENSNPMRWIFYEIDLPHLNKLVRLTVLLNVNLEIYRKTVLGIGFL